ncbi:DUF4276 family protein [Desulfococcaceae bacterium HSG9]|nr:DUF4276 family protein [Desulfococcaceae bacterium HSG9]
MIKIGIFVEGQTERIFVVKFLSEYLGGEHNFSRTEIINLGSKGTKIITERNFPHADFYFLIFDTTGDGNVVPAILERADNMIKNRGFRYILALEDLYDRPRNKKKYVLNQFNRLTAKFTFQDRLKLILAIMEIEAWFLADYNLFSRLNSIATPKFINQELNINLIDKNPESYNHPAEIINKIYKLCGMKYKKREQQTYNIVYNVDFDFLCSDEIIEKVKSWKYFVSCIDESISS